LKESKRQALGIILSLCAVFALYIYFTFDEVVLIHDQVQRSTYLSYGGFILFRILQELLKEAGLNVPALSVRVAFLFVVLSVLSAVYFLAARKTIVCNRDRIDGFRMGAVIYITSFLVWDNWDYRLIFLILALPQMFAWLKLREDLSFLSGVALICLPVTLWVGSGWPPDLNFRAINYFFVDELINWFLFSFFLYAFLATLPEQFELGSFRRLRESGRAQDSGFA